MVDEKQTVDELKDPLILSCRAGKQEDKDDATGTNPCRHVTVMKLVFAPVNPTNPNHPIAFLVPAHIPDQLQPKAFLILDELNLSYHPGQLAFPDSKRPVRTRRLSRSRSNSKQLASPIRCSRPQPQSVLSQLASSPARGSFFGGPVSTIY
ncbi:hypothetical protein YC2023_002616 [Brassica napus]